MKDVNIERLYPHNTFECGKTYYRGFYKFKLLKRVLCGVPNQWWGEFESDMFPFHFKVALHNNGKIEYFGGKSELVFANNGDNRNYRDTKENHIRYELCVVEAVWNIIDRDRKVMPDSAGDIVNAHLSDLGYSFFFNETTKKWRVKSDFNLTYFDTDNMGAFSTLLDAYSHLYNTVKCEMRSFK